MHTTANLERRRVPRDDSDRSILRIELKDSLGNPRWITADLLNRAGRGIGVVLRTPLKSGPNSPIMIRATGSPEPRKAGVIWCREGSGGTFGAGLEFLDCEPDARSEEPAVRSESLDLDCYELMQLSPNAELETIERVYRALAQRYHPDNAQTGSAERFIELSEAYRILSNPELRAGYDVRHRQAKRIHWKIFDQTQATIGREAEKRKRQGILDLLYAKTLQDPERATIGILEMEELLACPREHLEAALWYLRAKGYIQRLDSGRCAITVQGFDVAELGEDLPLLGNRQLTESRSL